MTRPPDAVLAASQYLVRAHIDAHETLLAAARASDAEHVRATFETLAAEHAEHAEELQRALAAAGVAPTDYGTFEGTLGRAWMRVRASLEPRRERALVTEVERALEHLVGEYRQRLPGVAGAPFSDVLHAQLASVLRRLDDLRALRVELTPSPGGAAEPGDPPGRDRPRSPDRRR